MSLTRLVCLMAAAASAAHAYQDPASAPPKGSIEGQVVNARTGAPLKRATVRVTGTLPQNNPAAPGVPGATGAQSVIRPALPVRPVMINQETDDQGRFVIRNLEAGKYRITAERQGFLRQAWGARKFSGGSTQVAVAEGQSVKSIDFRLMPQGVITGKVLDEDGEPMANVQVRAQRSFIRNGQRVWNTIANANTSDIGEYRLPELKPGRYVIMASPRNSPASFLGNTAPTEPLPANPELTYAATYYPSTADGAAAAPVDVGEGGETPHIDIRLVKGRVFRVRGNVMGIPENAAGRGRGGMQMVQVMLTPRDGTRAGELLLMGQARGNDGAFEIRNVPPGQYLAHAQTQSGQSQYIATAQVDVIGSHADGVILRMATGGDVQGSVKIVDGTPDVKNLSISLRPIGFGGQAPRARTEDDLKFTLKSVPPIRYAVNVSGYPDTCYVKSIRYGGVDVPTEGVEMTGGGVIEVTLSAAAAQLDVVVTVGDNKAANGAQIVLLRDGALESVRNADENGMLSLRGLKPASYRLIAWEDVDPELLWDPDYVKKFENEGKSVKLDASGHEALQLKAIPAQ